MKPQTLACLVVLALAPACTATHLVYVQEMNLGVDLSYSTEGTGHLVVGYDRNVFTLAPRKTGDGKATSDDLMSLAAVSSVNVAGLNAIDFNHFVATGKAAHGVVADEQGLRKIREAIYGPADTAGREAGQ